MFYNRSLREVLLMVSYDKLWKKLIDLKLKKKDLKDITGIGSTTMSKLTNNEPVSMTVMIKICIALKCNIGDVMDVVL
ncbi:XRE family transcriptional regulator [[Clostridium] leptum]|uniref:XRE family transcriptional regulator n=1 Tax=[Clostridium] leptum TaxID=1535 RepID=A0A412AWD8_9FIRM|nr:XRE family transcriptional regulator [[Clostridium] leptum]